MTILSVINYNKFDEDESDTKADKKKLHKLERIRMQIEKLDREAKKLEKDIYK